MEFLEVIHDAMYRKGIVNNTEFPHSGCFHLSPDHIVFSEEQWEELLSEPFQPFEKLEEMIPELCDDYCSFIRDCLARMYSVRSSVPGIYPCQLSDLIDEHLKKYYVISMDKQEWLNLPVWLNIGLNVDSWSDYTLNVTYPAYNWGEYEYEYRGCFGQSSIMWLTRRQGYKQADLREAQHLVKEDSAVSLIKSKYLYSAANEIWGEYTIYNQLGFFLKIPLKDVLLLKAMQRWGETMAKWPGYILISKDVRCGFFTTWVGSCSELGITLEKDVKLPLNNVEIFPDGTDGGYSMYSVHESYHAWDRGKILHWGFPRQFRRDASKYGFGQLNMC